VSIAYYHTTCGELLVFYKHDTPPVSGQLIKAGDWQLPNGNLFEEGALLRSKDLRCPKCREHWSFTASDLTPNFTPPA